MQDALTLALLAGYTALLALDFFAPARTFPAVKRWRAKGLVFFVLSITLFTTLPFLWDQWLGQYRLIDATGLPVWAGALLAIAVAQLFTYAWHRTMHNVPFLWRWFHQVHHSAERVDIYGAFYFHPLDIFGYAFIGSLALVLGVGVSPKAALIATSFTTVCAYFGHANLRTPRWLATSSSAPRTTPCTTSAACTPTTTPTSRLGHDLRHLPQPAGVGRPGRLLRRRVRTHRRSAYRPRHRRARGEGGRGSRSLSRPFGCPAAELMKVRHVCPSPRC